MKNLLLTILVSLTATTVFAKNYPDPNEYRTYNLECTTSVKKTPIKIKYLYREDGVTILDVYISYENHVRNVVNTRFESLGDNNMIAFDVTESISLPRKLQVMFNNNGGFYRLITPQEKFPTYGQPIRDDWSRMDCHLVLPPTPPRDMPIETDNQI
jgi:hypothetical protein